MSVTDYFKGAELVRMSNGDYCLVRPLGLVPGGKGMKHHINLLRLTPSGIASKLWGAVRHRVRRSSAAEPPIGIAGPEPSA